MAQIGRNDPCHCGSGRKYKQCHLREDLARATGAAEEQRARDAQLAAMGSPSPEEQRALYQELTGRHLAGDRIPAKIEESLIDAWRQRRWVAQARERLAEHAAAVERALNEDPAAFERVAEGLVAELDLSRFELTQVNRRRVLAQLGAPPEDPLQRRSYAQAAGRLVLVEEDRRGFHEGLLAELPALVEAERWTEAWVLERCAERALDPDAEATAFLEDVVQRSLRGREPAR